MEKNEFNYPVIANVITNEQFLHYCIVYGVKKEKLLIADPAIGKYKESIETFNKKWTGVILVPEKTPNFQPINNKPKSIFSSVSLLKNQYKKILFVTVFSLIITIIGILSSYYFRVLIDWLIPKKDFLSLFAISISYIIGIFITTIFEIARRYNLEKLGQNVGRDILLKYLEHIFVLPISFFYRRKTGDIVSRFSDANKIIEALASFILSIFLDLSSVIFVGVILFNINKQLFLITLSSVPFYIVIIWGSNKKMIRLNEEEMQKNSILDSNFIEGLNGIYTIKALCSEKKVVKQIYKSLNAFFDVSLKRNMYDSLTLNLKLLISVLTSAFVIWLGSYYVINGTITIGELIAFNSLSIFFSTPIQNIISLQEKFQKAQVANNRLNDVFSIDHEHKNKDVHLNQLPENSTITLKNICFTYSSKCPNVLDELSISFPISKNIGIKGDSGTGKSTLARLLTGFYSPGKGNIYINEQNIENINRKDLRKLIAYVPQESFIMSGTIRDNLVLGLENIPDEQELEKVLKDTYLWSFITELPLGLKTYLEENGTNLSGGQKQRIALARVLLSESKILLLDEATSALDSKTEMLIYEKLLKYPNKSIIIISHNNKLLDKCDLIIDLDEKTSKKVTKEDA
ncbi:peptidase domain-containing ABC transporter [Enterococcus hirae]|uniref:peptidase domain-containing ABC transporter n=1 Tax=Enterococcus hirae TaxID=1354 RepID=UPI001A95BCA7|nr:peptide cleavage/export ABC transporter [Enterococcus hirae]MBO1102228.1 peptide cleavage/export ABC transporter [Enterococcus hirae]